MRLNRPLLAFALILTALTLTAVGQERRRSVPVGRLLVSPAEVTFTVGEKQRFQLLDETGAEITGGQWSVSDTAVAALGQGELRALAPGVVSLEARVGGFSATATVTVLEAGTRLPKGTIRWSSPTLVADGRAVNQLQSVKISDDTPDIYFQEVGPGETTSYVRAFFSDGRQKWVWPEIGGPERVRLVCADNDGGVVLFSDRGGEYSAVVIDKDGKEKWRYASAPWKEYAYGPDNTFYILEKEEERSQVTALDGGTGQLKFAVPLPQSRRSGPDVRRVQGFGGSLVCRSRETQSVVHPATNGSLFISSAGFASVPVQHHEVQFGAESCFPGQAVDASAARLRFRSTFQLLKIWPTGKWTWHLLAESSYDGPDWHRAVSLVQPTGANVPYGKGGTLSAARSVTYDAVDDKLLSNRSSMYRLSDDDKVLAFDLPLPAGSTGNGMVLGETLAFISCANTVVAFDPVTGKVAWTWNGSSGAVAVNAALADGGLLVHDGKRLLLLDSAGRLVDDMFGRDLE